MVYRPKLLNGDEAPLSWQISLFYKVDFTWPLDDEATTLSKLFDHTKIFLFLMIYLYLVVSQFAFIYVHSDDVDQTLICIANELNLAEAMLRSIALLWKRKSFKETLDEFYKKIYIERVDNIEIKKYMDRHILPTRLSSYFMALTVFCFLAIPIYSLSTGLRLLSFPLEFFFDYTKLQWYILISILLSIAPTVIGSHLIAESNMIATFIAHLNGRYLILQEDIKQLYGKIYLKLICKEELCQNFQERLRSYYKWNEELNRFAQKLQDLYSMTLFIIMMDNVFILCILSFKIATAKSFSSVLSNIFWLMSRVIDLMIIGKLGSALTDTTDKMSSSYYNCNWELVTMKKSVSRGELDLLKLIRMIILLNQKPVALSAGNFFNVNLETVLAILKGAGSYFAVLYNLRE